MRLKPTTKKRIYSAKLRPSCRKRSVSHTKSVSKSKHKPKAPVNIQTRPNLTKNREVEAPTIEKSAEHSKSVRDTHTETSPLQNKPKKHPETVHSPKFKYDVKNTEESIDHSHDGANQSRLRTMLAPTYDYVRTSKLHERAHQRTHSHIYIHTEPYRRGYIQPYTRHESGGGYKQPNTTTRNKTVTFETQNTYDMRPHMNNNKTPSGSKIDQNRPVLNMSSHSGTFSYHFNMNSCV